MLPKHEIFHVPYEDGNYGVIAVASRFFISQKTTVSMGSILLDSGSLTYTS